MEKAAQGSPGSGNRITFRGAVLWSYVMNGGEKGIYNLATFVLAYLLGPGDFGLIAIAMAYITVTQMFLDQGFSLAVIQRKNLRPEHLDSAFWLVMASGLTLVATSVGLSGWWSRVNHMPTLAAVIRWLSLKILIEAFCAVHKAVLVRRLEFRSLSFVANVSVLIGAVTGVGMALAGFGVWALVGQKLSEDVVALLLLWRASRWRPRLRLSLTHLRELFGFALPAFVGRIGAFTHRSSIPLLMGLFFSPVAVGVYRLAERTVEFVLQVATEPLRIAAFPHISELQDRPAAIRDSMVSCFRLTAILTIPALAGLAAVSGPLTALMGTQWAPAANVLMILSPLGILLCFTRFVEVLLPALSRPHHLAILKWAECGFSVGLLILAGKILRQAPTDLQVLGVSLVRFTVAGLLFGPVLLFLVLRLSGVQFSTFLRIVSPSFAAAAAAVLVVIGLSRSHVLLGLRPAWVLAYETILGGFAALAVLWASDRQLRSEAVAYASRFFQDDNIQDPKTILETATVASEAGVGGANPGGTGRP